MKALGSQEIISVHCSPLFPKPSPLENQPKLWLLRNRIGSNSAKPRAYEQNTHTSQQSCAWRNWYHWSETRRGSQEEIRFRERKALEARPSAWTESSARAWTSTISCSATEHASTSPLPKEIQAREFGRRFQKTRKKKKKKPTSSTDYSRCFSSSSSNFLCLWDATGI